MERTNPEIDRWPEDPRTMLADRFRDFFLSALTQQEVTDGSMSKTVPAGSLYKSDGGFLKIHLQPPASDVVFHQEGREVTARELPDIWVLVPIMPGEDFETSVVMAERIIVHVNDREQPPLQFMAGDDYLGQISPITENPADLLRQEPPHETEQIGSAKHWHTMLEHYDLRSIVGNSQGQSAQTA